jgi:tetratricopeptide (TPR) repeat protein
MRRALPLVLLVAGVAGAQEKLKPEQFVEAAFKFLREGELDAASAAFDISMKKYPKGSAEERRLLAEAYDVAWVQSKLDRCARLAKDLDAVRQVRPLVASKHAEDALKVAQAARDALGQGIALRALGRESDALDVLRGGNADALAERGEILVAMGKFADAARDFEQAGDSFGRALALEEAHDAGAATAWESALVQGKKRLEGLLDRGTDAKKRLEEAQGIVALERQRFELSASYRELSREYEHLSIASDRTKDRAKALKLAELALQFAEESRKLLTDEGRDAYGVETARSLGLDAREGELKKRLEALR